MPCKANAMSDLLYESTTHCVEVLVHVGLGTVRLLYNLQEFQSFEASL